MGSSWEGLLFCGDGKYTDVDLNFLLHLFLRSGFHTLQGASPSFMAADNTLVSIRRLSTPTPFIDNRWSPSAHSKEVSHSSSCIFPNFFLFFLFFSVYLSFFVACLFLLSFYSTVYYSIVILMFVGNLSNLWQKKLRRD